jgi:hypothetical protein
MDDTLYSKSHNPPIVLTVEVLQDILQKVPKGTKVALYNTRECDGLYYISYITYDQMNGRVILEGPDSANPRTCRQMDEGAGWGEK